MVKAVRFHEVGEADVLKYEDIEVGTPGAGEVRIRQQAIGLNYIDVYHRNGLYPMELPSGIGLEAAGVIEEVGDGVANFAPGDRVAYGAGPIGAYAQARLIPAAKLVLLPKNIDFRQAAAAMLKGLTAQFLLRRTYCVKAGDTILIHAASGGVGSIACQWAKSLGATVIGTVGSDTKAEIAKTNGCDFPINYRHEDFVARVAQITNGEGVAVVYDAVGKDTFEKSLDCLKPMGMMVTFGNASGPVPAIKPLILGTKGSLFLTRPSLMTYMAKPEDMQASARDLFDVLGSGAIKISINQEYALGDAAQAHKDLEARKTTGSTVLIP